MLDPAVPITYTLAVTHALEIIKIYYPSDIFSLVSRSLSMVYKLRFGWLLETVLRFSICRRLLRSIIVSSPYYLNYLKI